MADVTPKQALPPAYLGDAVFASFDGYQIWLHLNHPGRAGVVALDPYTFRNLVEYGSRIWGNK